jgi:hypothetical protein
MFASDYPYDMATDAAQWIEQAPISEAAIGKSGR